MRKEVGDAAIKAGTNIISAAGIGLFFLNDNIFMVNSFVAIPGGVMIILIGVWYRNGGKNDDDIS